MKFTTALILAACLQVSARGYSQKISIDFNSAPIEKVFREIQNQSGYLFIYNDKVIEKASPVTIRLLNVSVQKALDSCLKNEPLSYEFDDKTIIIKDKPKIIVERALITITGIVTSDADEPLEGVTVRVKNTGKGTSTDRKGEFMLRDIADDAVLIITSIGFDQQEINTSGLPRIIIKLKVAVKGLDETIVKGYYNTSKRDNTSSIGKISSEEISRQPINNVLTALEGRITGLYVQQASGIPGSSVNIRLRGQNSIAAGNKPLFILDGIPIMSQSLTKYFSGAKGIESSPLNSLNPSDIESIEILKDADATAIYGSRGANGVIIINTKKGHAGKTNLDINVYSGVGKITHMIDMMNTEQYLKMRHEGFLNENATPSFSDYDVNGIWDSSRYTNWEKELIGKTTHINDVQLSFSTGNVSTQFIIGGGYHREGTVIPGDFFDQKASIHFRLNSVTPNKKLKVGFSGNYIHDDNNLPQFNPIFSISQAPDAPAIRDANGDLNWENATWTNPFAFLNQEHKSVTDNLIAGLDFNYEIFKGLNIKATTGYSIVNLNELIKTPKRYYNPAYQQYVQHESNFSTNFNKNWIAEPQLNYHITFGKGQFEIMTGVTFQESKQHILAQTGTGFATESLMDNLKAASSVQVNGADDIIYRYNAIFGRLNYKWSEKYVVNLTGRRDGSSRFGPEKQFANFGAAGIAWIFSKEKFFKNLSSVLSFAKLRSSYGTSGNDQIGDYNYFDSYSPVSNSYQGITPLSPQRISNPDYSWEINRKFEIGLELGFFNDHLNFSSNYFLNRSSNQLVGYPLPGITGFNSFQYNLPALVQNTGIEFEVVSTLISNHNFSWSANFNITLSRNKLVDYPNLSASAYANKYETGKSLFVQRTYHFTGIDRQSGLYTLEDVNKDGSYSDPEDTRFLKSKEQNYYGGFENLLSLKGIELDVFFQFVKQTGLNYLGYGLFEVPGTKFNQPTYVLNRWNTNAENPAVQKYTSSFSSTASDIYYNVRNSDAALGDASFIRMKNVSLSYQLPDKWNKKMHINSSRIYLQGQNLLTVTHYKGLDPESQGQIPPLKILVAGIHLTF